MVDTYREAWRVFHSQKPFLSSPFPSPTISNTVENYRHSSPDTDDGSAYSSRVSISGPMALDSSAYLPSRGSQTRRKSDSGRMPELLGEVQRLRKDFNNLQGAGTDSLQMAQLAKQLEVLSSAVSSSLPSSGTSTPPEGVPPPHSQPSPDSPESLRCWKSCCNGRVFSNKSNLIRHQREQRGDASKLRCSFCNAEFSRSSARNVHEAGRRCRKR